jgi:predicted nucleic acid-binding protein
MTSWQPRSLRSTTSSRFWDALIVVAAQRSGAQRLASEDLQHGNTIGGLRIENPFT